MEDEEQIRAMLVDRRKPPPDQFGLVIQMVRQIHTSQLQLEQKYAEHSSSYGTIVADAINKFAADALPNGDRIAHRIGHENADKASKDRSELVKHVRAEVIKWAIVAILGFVAIHTWMGFLEGPK
jgi:hypothetical protein